MSDSPPQALLGRTYEPNPALAYLYRRFFEHIQVDESWVEAVRRAAAAGSVVYVLRNLSFLDFLALDHLTKRYDLPRIRFANDLGLWILEPLGKGWVNKLLPQRGLQPGAELARVIEEGGSAALFLKRPPTILELAGGRAGLRRELSEGDDLVLALLELQRRRKTPILLVPQVFVWTQRPDRRGVSIADALLGTRQWPGKLRATFQFLSNYRHVVMRAGEPVNLTEYLQTQAEAGGGEIDDRVIVRRLTYTVLRRLERERRAILGPARKPNDRVRDEVIRSPKLQAIIRDLAGERAQDRMALVSRAYAVLRKLEAQPEAEVIALLDVFLDLVVNRLYDGIEVDEAGLERVRQAAKQGTLVLLPSHKSHVDYLILSYLFHQASLQLPLIAAGDNLSFFPLGPILRRGGGFFIRRSFAGDRLYATVVDAYIRRIIREGFSMEFFLEGGRSRTGKLLPPKFGLLNMVVEAALSVPGKPIYFVPVSIGYDRIVEEGAYVRELSGGEKQKENATGLLRGAKVLRGHYGRLNIQFGEIFTLSELAKQVLSSRNGASSTGANGAITLSPAKRRALVMRLGHLVMSEINRVTAVTPGAVVATALLNHSRRGMSHHELVEMSFRLIRVLIALGARVSTSLVTPRGELREAAIVDAANLFVRAELVQAAVPGQDEAARRRARIYTGPDAIYTVSDEKRLPLDLSKNIIVHFFVPRALIATAWLIRPGPGDGAEEGGSWSALDAGASASSAEPAATAAASLSAAASIPSVPSSRPAAYASSVGVSSLGLSSLGARYEPGGAVARSVLEGRVRNLSRLFKFEFMFRADATFEENFSETLEDMIRHGELASGSRGEITLGSGREGLDGAGWIRFYASLMRTFLEGYRVAARGLSLLLKGPLAQKELVRRTLLAGERMYLAGEIARREAVSRPLIENALLAFADQGYVTSAQSKIALTESFATAAAVGAIEGRISAYAGLEVPR